jgi:hypothetical protein
MSCMLLRVGQNGDAIREGVKTVFVSKMDVFTALLFAKSSREFLHRAKSGYKLPSAQNDHQVNRMEIQMNQVHKDMGQHCANTSTSSSREDGGSSRESTKKTSNKESLSSGNGSRGDGPAQKALASDLARSTLQADEAVPVQDQAPIPSRSKKLAPAEL